MLIDPNLGANDQKCPEVLYHTKKTLKSQMFWVDLYQKGKHVAVLALSPLLCTRGSRGSRLDLEMAEEWGKIPRLVSSSTSKNKDEKSRS